MSPHLIPLFGEDQRPDPGDSGNRAYIKVPKHQYLDVSRGISKLITHWNPVINCSTRSPGDNSSIICSRKEKFSISPVGRKTKEINSITKQFYLKLLYQKGLINIKFLPHLDFLLQKAENCRPDTRRKACTRY